VAGALSTFDQQHPVSIEDDDPGGADDVLQRTDLSTTGSPACRPPRAGAR
jgi:hypothetical protein